MEFIQKAIPETNTNVFLRKGTSDEDLFRALIEEDEYGYIKLSSSSQIIIDAGANIGLSSLYFSTKYPNAKIYAIEPEKSNFDMLVKNTEDVENIIPIYGALMGNEGKGVIYDPGLGSLGYQIRESEKDDQSEKVSFVTIESICRKYGLDHIDLLKMDIEGAEKDIFSHSPLSWLSIVSALIIELHERIAEGCNRIVFDAVKPYFQLEWIGGENFYFSKEGVAWPFVPLVFKKGDPLKLPVEEIWKLRQELSDRKASYADIISPIYQRIDQLEQLYKRVDAVEGVYPRVDQLDQIYKKKIPETIVSLNSRLDFLQKAIEELQDEVFVLRQTPLQRLSQKVKHKGKEETKR